MRAIIQRVHNAILEVEEKKICEIEKGLVVYTGFKTGEENEDLAWIVNKISGLRIFEDENEKMNLSLSDVNGKIMIVPNFTLYADCSQGFRPSFSIAMQPSLAKPLFSKFVDMMKEKLPNKVECGIFGADMQINQTNDGPITIFIET